MSSEYLSRALQVLLQPLQGSHSLGAALVNASAQTTLQPGKILCPVVNGKEADDCCVKVDPNPASSDGSWLIPKDGAEVSVSSLQGGTHVNLPEGTALRFDDPPALVSPTSSLVGAMTGGSRREELGALRQVRVFKDLGNKVDQAALFAAQIGEYPAAVLSWSATIPGDGSTSPSLGADATRVGNGKRIYCHEWVILLISSRRDSTNKRRREGDVLRDNVLEMLTDRTVYRGLDLSASIGIKVTDARPVSATESAYVDAIKFSSWFILEKRDSRTFTEWRTTSVTGQRPTSAGAVTIPSDARFVMR